MGESGQNDARTMQGEGKPRPLSRLRLAACVGAAWIVASVAAAGVIAPSGHLWILYLVPAFEVGVFAAVVHALAILLVRGPLPTSNAGSLLAAAVVMVPFLFLLSFEPGDRPFLRFLAVTVLAASQLVYWIVARPLAKRAATPLRDREAG